MTATHDGDVMVETAASLSSWSDLIRDRFVPLEIAPRDSEEVRGSVRSRYVGHLLAAVVTSAPQRFERTKSLVTAGNGDLLAVGLVERGAGYLEQDGRRCVLSDGGFALYDTTRPFTWTLEGDWRLRVFTWPRPSIALSDAHMQRLTAVPVPGDTGVGAVLSPMLRQISDDAPYLSPISSVRVADEMAELAVIAASEIRSDDGWDSGDRDLLRRIHTYIEEHLTDPRLDSSSIAREFFVSTRTLHRLFARQGVTAAAWITRRRLEACRRALMAPGAADTPINLVATRYGFTNASYFSRRFAAEFGASPRQFRIRHLSDGQPGQGIGPPTP